MNKLLAIAVTIFLYLTFIYAQPLNGTEIVDEAKTISIRGEAEDSSDDTTRTIMVDNKITIYKNIIKLSSASKRFIITITDAFHLPNTLLIEHNGKIVKTKQSSVPDDERDISFSIQKEDLSVGDKIIITTTRKDKIVELEIVK